VLGAIVIAGSSETQRHVGSTPSANISNWHDWHSCPSSIPVLGCSTVVRTVEYLRQNGIDEVCVLGGRSHGTLAGSCADVESHAWRSAATQLRDYREDGLEMVLVLRTGAYVECDLASFIGQHQQEGPAVTRAVGQDGPLDVWVADIGRINDDEGDLFSALTSAKAAECETSGYVNRLRSPQDLRRLATDLMTGKCKMRPHGVETRPGIWIDEGAQVARGARIVAPAYIGRDTRVADDSLITRCSNVESWSHVDFGTAVEDSSILTNTYVGIGLDLSHSIVDGDELLNLHHEVRLHISDPVVMRRNSPRGYQREQLTQPEASEMIL
jgi:hypothetical protein